MVLDGFAKRVGLLVFAAGGIAALLLASQAVGQQPKAGNYPAAKTTQQPTKPSAAAPQESPKASTIYQPECGRPRDKEEYTLCADVRAAEAAERASDLAAEQVRIGWLQAAGLVISLAFTGWAAWAAAAAAKAARKSVEHAEADSAEQAERFGHQLHIATTSANAASSAARATRALAGAAQRSADAAAQQVAISDDTARKQLRAYVGAQAINYTFNRETGVFAVSAEIKNFGQTPAFNFRLLGGLNYIDFPIKDAPEVRPFLGESHTLFPTMTTYVGQHLPANEERILHLRSGRGAFLFTILLEYTDHQGIQHEETIRSYATGNPVLDRFTETHTATMTFWRGEST